MIGRLEGILSDRAGLTAVILTGGVGYEVICTREALKGKVEGGTLSLVIHTDVKEDSIRLYGFSDLLERQVFRLLLTVKGVGAKSASEVLTNINKRALLRAIALGDVTALTKIKGIGKKTAERIVVELKEKVGELAFEASADREAEPLTIAVERTPVVEDAVTALITLGFSKKDAERMVEQVEKNSALSAGDLVREALRFV